MTKTISKVGNSQGLIFDATLMDQAHLKVGDQVNVTVHEGGSIVLTPVDEHRTEAGGGGGSPVDSQEPRVVQAAGMRLRWLTPRGRR